MEKTKNCWVIQTDKPSRLYEFGGQYFIQEKHQENFRSYNIYITDNSEIKEGDWVFDIFKNACPAIRQLTTEEEVLEVQKTELKIILTTNQDLIKDGVQAIDDEFLEFALKMEKLIL